MNIVDVGAKFGYPVANIFNPWKPDVIENPSIQLVQNMNDIDLICFGGGADISPTMYGHQNINMGVSIPSQRDLFEREVWKVAQDRHIPVFGVCRGAQMVCVLSGGSLIQDIQGHTKMVWHKVMMKDGKEIPMSSYHHQMMYPFSVKHDLLGWVVVNNPNTRSYLYDTTKITSDSLKDKEPEIVYFPDTNALGVQAHPEYEENPLEPSQVYTRQLVNQYLLNGEYE